MTPQYSEMQLDALAELANIASGTAATALSQMLGREVELRVPRALALPLADAVDAAGAPEDIVTGVVLGPGGRRRGARPAADPGRRRRRRSASCSASRPEPRSATRRSGRSATSSAASYLNALSTMTGLTLLPTPPTLATDLLGAIVASVLAQTAGENDIALVLDSELDVADQPCSLSFLLLPASGRADELLAPLGLAGSGE